MRSREGKSEIERSEQHVQNWSFDEKFKVLATENLVFDPEGNTLNRMKQPTTPTDNQSVDILNSLRAVLLAITNPPYIDKSANQARVQATISSGTVTTVSTVTGLTNFGSQAADVTFRINSNNAWANNVRRLIS
jgi:hypothetical protein